MPGIAPPDHPPDDPTLARAPAPLRLRQSLLGHDLRLEADDKRVVAAARELFGPPLPGENLPGDVVMRLLSHAVESNAPHRQPLIRRQGMMFTIATGREAVVAGDSAAGTAFGFLPENVRCDKPLLRDGFVQATALSLLAPRFLAVAHAAGLVLDGQALMVRGDSGAGKSTFTYAALLDGWSLLSEDAIYVAATPGDRLGAAALQLHGVPWQLHLLPDVAQLFPELSELTPEERLSGERKLRIDVAQHFSQQCVTSAAFAGLVFVAAGKERRPRLRQLSAQESRARLVATSIYDERHLAAATGLWDAYLERPVYLLERGDDPGASVQLLKTIAWGA